MSIYRRRGWDNVSDVHPLPSSDSPAGPPYDWSKHRKARPANHLLPLSETWMDALPPGVFPGALASHYPRIVNLIALQWNDRTACPTYFEDLLADRRGGRQGFPPAIVRDLQRLRDYWYIRRRPQE